MPTLLHRARGIIALVALVLSLTAIRVNAQASADSAKGTTARIDTSAAGYGEGSRETGVDTSRAPAPADTVRRASSDSASSALPQAGIPSDSVLAVTCRSMRAGSVAPGLLLVLFGDSATQKDRSAAVTRAGGATAGEAPGGGEYVRVASDTMSGRTLAHQLMQDPAVASVSERTCPSGF